MASKRIDRLAFFLSACVDEQATTAALRGTRPATDRVDITSRVPGEPALTFYWEPTGSSKTKMTTPPATNTSSRAGRECRQP